MFQHCDIRLSVTRFIGVQSQLHSQQYFSSISFIYGRNWRKPLRCHKPLTTLITKGCIKYTPPSFPRIKGHNFKTISTNSILYKNVQYVHYFCIDVCNFLIQLSYNVITGIKLNSPSPLKFDLDYEVAQLATEILNISCAKSVAGP